MSATIGRTSLAYSRSWHLVDIGHDQRAFGRIATSIATTLMGWRSLGGRARSHRLGRGFVFDADCGDYVVAVGCAYLKTTGNKRSLKKYYSHSTRPGSLKEITMDRMIVKYGGAEVLRRAVRGMLPKNRLRDIRLERLKAFEGFGHPYKPNLVRFNDPTHPSKTPVTDAIKSELLEPGVKAP